MQDLKTIKCLLAFSIWLLLSCHYNVEEELYETIDCITTDISYAQDILPILELDCFGCHSTEADFGNVTLEGYSQISQYVSDGSLLGSVSYDGGFSPMPKGGAKLLDCEIAKIDAWIIDGAPNN